MNPEDKKQISQDSPEENVVGSPPNATPPDTQQPPTDAEPAAVPGSPEPSMDSEPAAPSVGSKEQPSAPESTVAFAEDPQQPAVSEPADVPSEDQQPAPQPEPQPEVPQPTPVSPQSTSELFQLDHTPVTSSPKKSKLPLMLAGLVLVVALVAGIYFFFIRSDTKSATNKAAKASQKTAASSIQLTSLSKFALVPPTNLNGYQLYDIGTPTVKDYRNAGNTCELQFGTLTATQLPGVDLADIVAKSLATYRQNGITVNGPNYGTAITLKDATDSSKTYSLPTLVFTVIVNNKHGLSHYSAGVLPGGERVVITRVCSGATDAAAEAAIGAVETMTQQITVSPQ